MRRNSSPTALADSSRDSWTDAVDATALVFRDSDSDGPGGAWRRLRGPWTNSCMTRSPKGGEHRPTAAPAARTAFDFVTHSVVFSWQALWACHARSWHTERNPTISNRISMQVSPAERDALTLLLERDQKPAEDAAERRLMRMRASVCRRLQALTFEASTYDWERSSIILSTDEADLVLDTLGPSASGPLAGLQRRTADRRYAEAADQSCRGDAPKANRPRAAADEYGLDGYRGYTQSAPGSSCP